MNRKVRAWSERSAPTSSKGESDSSPSTACRAIRSHNKGAHPFHRSWLQAQYDDYVASEVFPFIDSVCQTPGIPITTYGASLGAYHAANTLFKHPDHVKRCYALSGVYDLRDSMDGMYDDNFYFNNPVDYMANQNDPWFLHQLASCDIHLATGCWSVGEQRPDLPNVRGAREPRHSSSSGRLGPERRPRMALLASPDVGVRGRAFLKSDPTQKMRREWLINRLVHLNALSIQVLS